MKNKLLFSSVIRSIIKIRMILNSIIANQLNSNQNNLMLAFPFIITIAEAKSKKGKKALQSSMIFTIKWFDNTILFS